MHGTISWSVLCVSECLDLSWHVLCVTVALVTLAVLCMIAWCSAMVPSCNRIYIGCGFQTCQRLQWYILPVPGIPCPFMVLLAHLGGGDGLGCSTEVHLELLVLCCVGLGPTMWHHIWCCMVGFGSEWQSCLWPLISASIMIFGPHCSKVFSSCYVGYLTLDCLLGGLQ